MPDTLADVLAIAHQDVTVTVSEVYQSSLTPLENIKLYLFTTGGAYQGINATTNSQGKVTFNLPQKDYKVRADYLGGQYWSQVFTAQEIAVDIPHGYANVQVSEHGAAVYNAPVYLVTGTGSYLGRMLRTDGASLARFRIPAGSYKFRVDYNGRQYWSNGVNILANEETAVVLARDLLALNLTNDPDPVRFNGIPPRLEQQPKYEQKRVLLASLFDISGVLANSVVAQIPTEDKIYYYINDHLGTPQKMMDQSGAAVWSAVYSPFGNAMPEPHGITNNLRFPGQYFDAETGLHYNWHRYYDPEAGRYLTSDPIGIESGINLYTYASNNPINAVDPLATDVYSLSLGLSGFIGKSPYPKNRKGYAIQSSLGIALDTRTWKFQLYKSTTKTGPCSEDIVGGLELVWGQQQVFLKAIYWIFLDGVEKELHILL